jgi:hypothetical protein
MPTALGAMPSKPLMTCRKRIDDVRCDRDPVVKFPGMEHLIPNLLIIHQQLKDPFCLSEKILIISP